jgi:group I intron endonuclease
MFAFLYCITNSVNGKKYIGVTIDPDRRKKEHFSKSRKGSKLVQRAIVKYGKDSLKFEILESGDETEMYISEGKYISDLNCLVPNGYNIAEGGLGGKTGIISEETKIKMSTAHIGKKRNPHSVETKQKMRLAAINRKASPETKKKMSESHSKEKNHMFGKTHSVETKQKISDAKRSSN